MSKKNEVFDVVVVGSGAAGGWAAKKLAEGGCRVALVEAGTQVLPQRDFTDHTPPHQLPFRGKVLPRALRERFPIQRTSYAFSEQTSQFFVADKEQPYTTPADRPFVWIRCRKMGGRTLVWGRVSLRFSQLDLDAGRVDGRGGAWPLTYEELAPYYDEVEEFVGVSGEPSGLPHVPAGRYLPSMNLSCAEERFRDRVREKFGRKVMMAPAAVLTQAHRGRGACHHCGPCERGCTTASYFSAPSSTIPAAKATGKLTVFTQTVVSHVTTNADGRARGVVCVDARTGARREVRGRSVALCASTLESTRILLNSKSAQHPHGLGNASGVLGRYLMDSPGVMGIWTLPDMRGVQDSPGYRPTTLYVPRFRNVADDKQTAYVRGFAFQGMSRKTSRQGSVYAARGFGADLKRRALSGEGGEWYLWLLGFGECLPRFENHCRLDGAVKDRFGIPALHIDMGWGENELAMAKDIARTSHEMADAAGAKRVFDFPPTPGVPGSAVHEAGTARMGADPKTSFLDKWNRSHVVKNLYVMDGASFPSLPCQNPTLTIMALAARASDHLLGELKRQNI